MGFVAMPNSGVNDVELFSEPVVGGGETVIKVLGGGGYRIIKFLTGGVCGFGRHEDNESTNDTMFLGLSIKREKCKKNNGGKVKRKELKIITSFIVHCSTG
jgi:hypothetical protein